MQWAIVVATIAQQHEVLAPTVGVRQRQTRGMEDHCGEIEDIKTVRRQQRWGLVAHGSDGVVARERSGVPTLHHLLDRRPLPEAKKCPCGGWLVVAVVDDQELLVG